MIRKLPSGKYQANYYYYDGSHLKKKTKSFTAKKDAVDFELQGKANRKKYEYQSERPTSRTIADLIQHYKSLARYTSLRKGTKKQYDRLANNFLEYCEKHSIPYSFNFTTEDARNYESYVHRTATGRGITHQLMFVKLLFSEDMNRDNASITKNPFAQIKAPRNQRKEVRFYTAEELRMFFDCCFPYQKHLFSLLLYTGMRTAELIHLTWDKVKTDHILISESKDWKPKSPKSYRRIPLNKHSHDALEALRGNGIYVTGGNMPLNIGSVYKRFTHVLNRVQKKHHYRIENNVHGFRRTFGSILLQEGVPIAVISNLLGHESISTTERLYASLREQDLHDAVQQMPRF